MGGARRLTCLLDTHVLLWFRIQPDFTGTKNTQALKSAKKRISHLSHISTRNRTAFFKNQITLPQTPDVWFEDSLRHFNTRAYPLTPEIFAEAYRIPEPFHPNPTDRILVASACLGDYTLITADRRILNCSTVRTLDARK